VIGHAGMTPIACYTFKLEDLRACSTHTGDRLKLRVVTNEAINEAIRSTAQRDVQVISNDTFGRATQYSFLRITGHTSTRVLCALPIGFLLRVTKSRNHHKSRHHPQNLTLANT